MGFTPLFEIKATLENGTALVARGEKGADLLGLLHREAEAHGSAIAHKSRKLKVHP